MTLELCCHCDQPTGRAGAGEDSIYAGETGPFCPECRDNFGDILGEIIDKQSRELAASRQAMPELIARVKELEGEARSADEAYDDGVSEATSWGLEVAYDLMRWLKKNLKVDIGPQEEFTSDDLMEHLNTLIEDYNKLVARAAITPKEQP